MTIFLWLELKELENNNIFNLSKLLDTFIFQNLTSVGTHTLIGGFVGAVIFAVVFVALQLHYIAIMRRKNKTLARLQKESEDMDEKIRRLSIENDRRSEKSNGQLD